MPTSVASIAKAIVGGVLASLSALSAYLVNNTSFGQITAGQWVQVVLAGLVVFAAVFGVPNAGKAG